MLTDGKCIIYNVPDISDVHLLIEMMQLLGSKVTYENEIITIDNSQSRNALIPTEYTTKLNSYYFMGVLLSKYKHSEISYRNVL